MQPLTWWINPYVVAKRIDFTVVTYFVSSFVLYGSVFYTSFVLYDSPTIKNIFLRFAEIVSMFFDIPFFQVF